MLVNFSTSGDIQNDNAVGVNEVQAILRSIGYKINSCYYLQYSNCVIK